LTDRPSDIAPLSRKAALAGGLVLAALAVAGIVLLVAVLLGRGPGRPGTADATPTADPASFAYAAADPAPALELTDQDGKPFALTALLGRPVLVFFGYTHCPDVCPATVGKVSEALTAVGEGPRAVFASIDPERDDVAAMKSYLKYLPKAFTGLSGTPQEVHENAVRWGVSYTRLEQGLAGGYAMGHTADIFLVDAQGRLRAHFPFGTESDSIVAQLRTLLAETPIAALPSDAVPPSAIPSTAAPSAPPSAAPATQAPVTGGPPGASPVTGPAALLAEVVSTSIWAGTGTPVILRVNDGAGHALVAADTLTAALSTFDGTPQGNPVVARGILPEGASQAYFVATVDIPSPGAWKLHLTSGSAAGDVTLNVLAQGSSLPIGGPAPDIDTPTLDDVGGVVRAVTTQPEPDMRLSKTSTADARAMGKPYVIVIDSARFKVSPECGRALTMIRYLLDRWGDRAVFIHLEPFEYRIVTGEPVLSGTLTDPPMNRFSLAWGLGDATWPGTRMPWVFVVDGNGTIRAKYTGIVGSADVDVMLSVIQAEAGG
jgi:protein SCO1/2